MIKSFHGSTLVAAKLLPLIDAVTGAPDGPFPTRGSEVVSIPAGVQKPCSKVAPSLRILPGRRVFLTAFVTDNLAHLQQNVKGWKKENVHTNSH